MLRAHLIKCTKKLKLLFLLFSLIFSLTNTAILGKNLIFDLGGVIVQPGGTLSSLKELWQPLLLYLVTLHNPLGIKNRLFQVLHELKPLTSQIIARDQQGNPLPQYLHEWLLGTQTPTAISREIRTRIEHTDALFTSQAEKSLITALIPVVLNAMKQRDPLPEAIEFVRARKAEGNKLYILSNLDTESFDDLFQRNPDFFALFDGIIISGHIHLLKPDKQIYAYLLEKFELVPTECIFFDDQQENIAAARALGIETIHCRTTSSYLTPWSTQPDFSAMQKDFAQLIQNNQTRIA